MSSALFSCSDIEIYCTNIIFAKKYIYKGYHRPFAVAFTITLFLTSLSLSLLLFVASPPFIALLPTVCLSVASLTFLCRSLRWEAGGWFGGSVSEYMYVHFANISQYYYYYYYYFYESTCNKFHVFSNLSSTLHFVCSHVCTTESQTLSARTCLLAWLAVALERSPIGLSRRALSVGRSVVVVVATLLRSRVRAHSHMRLYACIV